MLVADQFCVSRLINLCELYITFEVDRKCSQQIEKSEIDVIGLLLGAQVFKPTVVVIYFSSGFCSPIWYRLCPQRLSPKVFNLLMNC